MTPSSYRWRVYNLESGHTRLFKTRTEARNYRRKLKSNTTLYDLKKQHYAR